MQEMMIGLMIEDKEGEEGEGGGEEEEEEEDEVLVNFLTFLCIIYIFRASVCKVNCVFFFGGGLSINFV